MVQNAENEKKLEQLLAVNMEKIVTAISRDPVKIARKLQAEKIITKTVYQQVAEGHGKGVPIATLATAIQTNAYLTFELDVELLPTFFDILKESSPKFAAGLGEEYEAIMSHKGIDQRQPQTSIKLNHVDICERLAKQPAAIGHLAEILHEKGFIVIDVAQTVKADNTSPPYNKASTIIGPAIDCAEREQEMHEKLVTILDSFKLL